MSKSSLIIETISAIAEVTLGNKDVKASLFGEYSDGSPRNLPDAIRGEILSPKQKLHSKKKKKKHKKKKESVKFRF